MMRIRLMIPVVMICIAAAGCGYRFVDPFPASDYSLVSVRNSTPEAKVGLILEEELRRIGGFRENSSNRLSVTVTRFSEKVVSIGSSGSPVRQELAMDIAWKVDDTQGAQATFGKESVSRSYPYSDDPTTLDWNRNAAVRLLSEMGARKVLSTLGSVR